MCALYHESNDVLMKQANRVQFDETQKSSVDIIPYSEVYGCHPHLILASQSGRKRSPSCADPFTGKTQAVMKARRVQARKKLGTKSARKARQSILNAANQGLSELEETKQVFTERMIHEPINSSQTWSSPFRHNDDIEMKDAPNAADSQDTAPMIYATRTKPVKSNKFAKRIGAKTAKKIELEKNAAFTLSPQDATTYRALAARCNYLAQDRADLSYASKELCREFNIPNLESFKKLKRLVRYLAGLPRLVYRYSWQTMPTHLDVFVDTDFAGCQTTRRSTSGGAALLGQCLVRHWSKISRAVHCQPVKRSFMGLPKGLPKLLGFNRL